MNKIMDKIDLSVLPEDARKEVVDFYLFLKKRYTISKKRNSDRLPDEFFKPFVVEEYLKINRDEIYQDV